MGRNLNEIVNSIDEQYTNESKREIFFKLVIVNP
jgi:hypothetical protein